MKFYSIVKICHKILTSAVIVLSIIQGYMTYSSLKRDSFPPRVIPFMPFYYFVLIWLYITGILIAIKAIFSFKEKKILLGIVLLIICFLFFIFSRHIVWFFLSYIYLIGT
jgi:hypothetical protein